MAEMVGRAVNLSLPFVLLKVHGIDAITDSFFLALAIAFFFQGTLANALTNALVPNFVTDSKAKALNPILYSALFCGALAGLTTWSFTLNNGGYPGAILSVLSIVLIATTGLASAPATAALYADHKYSLPGGAWGLRALPVGLYFFYPPVTPAIHWLLLGLALADLCRLLILLYCTRDRLRLSRTAPALQLPPSAFYLLSASIIAGLSPLVVRAIASYGPAGSVSLFEASDRIYSAIASFASIGAGNVTLVYLARIKQSNNERQEWRWILFSTLIWSLIWLGISLIIWSLLPYITTTLNIIQLEISSTVQNTLLALAIGLPGFMLTGVLSRRMLTLNIAEKLIPLAIIGLAFTGISCVYLFEPLGTPGLALSLSLSHYLVAALMAITIQKSNTHAHTHTV